MEARFSNKQKWWLAAGLMVIFFPLNIYVNAPSDWSKWAGPYNLNLITQVAISIGMTYVWISFSEWLMERMAQRLGDYLLDTKRIWPHLISLSIFMIISTIGTVLTLEASLYLAFDVLKMPCPLPDVEHARRVHYGQFAAISLCLYIIIVNRRTLQHHENMRRRAEQLEQENLLSQYGALKSQVNPHFLFNSLSILSSLVKKDPARSEQFIDQLSKAYRYILEQREAELVPLSTELEFLRAYSFLLETRFEDKFQIGINLPKDLVEQAKIAPLTLQLLVENAVKHNQMSLREPLQIRIAAEKDTLVVSNNFRPRGEAVDSTGVGLQNIVNRYALLTDRAVWAGEREERFEVRIPIIA